MSMIESPQLLTNYEDLRNALATDSTSGFVRPSVSTRLVKDVTVESTFVQYDREFTFHADEARSRGGHEQGPSPMRYFLSGIAFCLAGWYAKGSIVADVELDGLDVDLSAYMDMRGEHGFDGVPANPQWLAIDVRVATRASPYQVVTMVDWGDARCPLGVFARLAVPVYQRVAHNGQVLRDTRPAES